MMKHSLKLDVKGDRQIVMTRAFDAPRELVFEAYTTPALLKRWLGVRGGWTFPICEVDLRVGGSYRFVWRKGDDGPSLGVSGVYREIVAPERIVCTEKFDDPWYPGEGLTTITFVEHGGTTTLSAEITYESSEARDTVVRSPMEGGVAESYDNLERLLAQR